MEKKEIFKGAATALVTPFSAGEIDYPTLGSLIDWQIECGIDALVIGGTTAEAATLSDDERYKLYTFAKEKIDGRTKLILPSVGVGKCREGARNLAYIGDLVFEILLLVFALGDESVKHDKN